MATTITNLTTTSSSTTYHPSRGISDLRVRAQAHLMEIEEQRSEEQCDRLARDLQLQLYSKPAHRPSPPQHQLRHQGIKSTSKPHAARPDMQMAPEIEVTAPLESKLPKLRTALDVLNRIQHDDSLKMERCEYVIGYLERFDGILEMPFDQWKREITNEEFIPQHRIRYITRRWPGDDEVVWSRDERVDRIFGSGSGTVHI